MRACKAAVRRDRLQIAMEIVVNNEIDGWSIQDCAGAKKRLLEKYPNLEIATFSRVTKSCALVASENYRLFDNVWHSPVWSETSAYRLLSHGDLVTQLAGCQIFAGSGAEAVNFATAMKLPVVVLWGSESFYELQESLGLPCHVVSSKRESSLMDEAVGAISFFLDGLKLCTPV